MVNEYSSVYVIVLANSLSPVFLDIFKFSVSHFPGLKISVCAFKYVIKDVFTYTRILYRYAVYVHPCLSDLKSVAFSKPFRYIRCPVEFQENQQLF